MSHTITTFQCHQARLAMKNAYVPYHDHDLHGYDLDMVASFEKYTKKSMGSSNSSMSKP